MIERQKVLDLKPTQFAVGMLEVDKKIEIVRAYGKKKIRWYVEKHPVPIVISPHGERYLVDHHHFLIVCYHVGIKKVNVRVVDDLSRSKMSYSQFWKWMCKTHNVYLFCPFGEGPRNALYLPRDIRGLADDPYRSVAWFVRKSGAFEHSDRNFAEFKWANFFRSHRLLDRLGLRCFPQAMVKAVALAQSPAAKRLPGFGKLNFGGHAKLVRSEQRKAVLFLRK
jgi:hypothetical protein